MEAFSPDVFGLLEIVEEHSDPGLRQDQMVLVAWVAVAVEDLKAG